MASFAIFMEGCGSSSDSADSKLEANTVQNIRAPEVKTELINYSGFVKNGAAQISFSGQFGSLVSPGSLIGGAIIVELSQGSQKKEAKFSIRIDGQEDYGFNIDDYNLPQSLVEFGSVNVDEPIQFRILYGDIEISTGSFFLTDN